MCRYVVTLYGNGYCLAKTPDRICYAIFDLKYFHNLGYGKISAIKLHAIHNTKIGKILLYVLNFEVNTNSCDDLISHTARVGANLLVNLVVTSFYYYTGATNPVRYRKAYISNPVPVLYLI